MQGIIWQIEAVFNRKENEKWIYVDRVFDMFRMAVNVFSDSCGAALIAQDWK